MATRYGLPSSTGEKSPFIKEHIIDSAWSADMSWPSESRLRIEASENLVMEHSS